MEKQDKEAPEPKVTDKAPEKAEEAQPKQPDMSDVLSKLEDLENVNKEKDARIEELSSKLESTKDTMDSLLEEQELSSDDFKDLLDEDSETSEQPKAEEKTETKEEPQAETKEEEKEVNISDDSPRIDKGLEAAIREDEKWKASVQARLEQQEMERDIDKLTPEFPEANVEDVLLHVEAGDKRNLEELFKENHEKNLQLKEQIKKEVEENLKKEQAQEAEGNKSVPQSPATSTPTPSESPTPTAPFREEEMEWIKATKQGKSSLGE